MSGLVMWKYIESLTKIFVRPCGLVPQPLRPVPSFAFFHNSIIKVVMRNTCNWKVCIALTKGLTGLMVSQEQVCKCVAAES